MTIYLERFADVMKRLIATVGGEALQGLSPELQAVVVLEADRPEFQALGGTKLWMAYSGALAAGGAGHFNEVLLATGDAKMITVVTHVYSVANLVTLFKAPVVGMTGPVANAVQFRDNRLGGLPGTRLFTKDAGATALPSAATGRLLIPAGTLVTLPPTVAIAGGYLFENQTNNQTMELFVAGYERYTNEHETDATVS